MQTWLIMIGGLVSLGILLDAIRRMRNAGRDSFNMDLHMQKGLREEDPLVELRAELPNGGARTVSGEVKIPEPKPSKSAAFLAKEGAKAQSRVVAENSSAFKSKVEPKFSTLSTLEDTQKTRRTPTMTPPSSMAVTGKYPRPSLDLDQAVPMLMDADDQGEATFNDDRDMLMGTPTSVLSKPRIITRSMPADDIREEQEVIVINVMSKQLEGFVGSALLENVLVCGMRYGNMNIFHQYAPAPDDDNALYSMANIVKPGTFDLNSMQSFQTPGVSFFMMLPLKTSSPVSAMEAFDRMLAAAKKIAQNLNGELKDERRSVMTGQTIEHCRQRISEFSRKTLSRSGKFTADH